MKIKISVRKKSPRVVLIVAFALAFFPHASLSHQQNTIAARSYPKEIRGYKVEVAKVKIKQPRDSKRNNKDTNSNAASSSANTAAGSSSAANQQDALIQLGDPRVVSITPLGITLEVPITVAAVEQGGQVDFLTFEDMIVNGSSVSVEDYMHPFDLPNERALTLHDPVRIYVSTTQALSGAISEWSKPKDVWPVTGRVYVFGRFKKFLFSFKRVVPVELNLTLRNPLKSARATSPPAN